MVPRNSDLAREDYIPGTAYIYIGTPDLGPRYIQSVSPHDLWERTGTGIGYVLLLYVRKQILLHNLSQWQLRNH